MPTNSCLSYAEYAIFFRSSLWKRRLLLQTRFFELINGGAFFKVIFLHLSLSIEPQGHHMGVLERIIPYSTIPCLSNVGGHIHFSQVYSAAVVYAKLGMSLFHLCHHEGPNVLSIFNTLEIGWGLSRTCFL